MKNISTLILFCLTFTFITVKAQTKAELAITIKDCRESKNYTYLSELKVLKNGVEYVTFKPQSKSNQILDALELGTYSLVYRTLFDKEQIFIVDITESKKYDIIICTNFIDYSKETYEPIIDKLKDNETYSIYLASQGCFHSNKDSISIKRTNNFYIMTWGEESKKLNQQEIEVVRNFEMELNYMTDGGCTTTDTYIIKYKEMEKRIDDGTCSWDGGIYLKKQIFGKTE